MQDRELATSVRTLGLKEVLKALKLPDNDDFKKAVILKLAGTLLPRLNEHEGAGGGAIQIAFDKSFSCNSIANKKK